MKVNDDTNYATVSQRAKYETDRNLQHRKTTKIVDNAAISLYQRDYKRCAVRILVRQIKDPDFKKWKK